MVFFTCQHCGASLKKNAVEKHYMTVCRNRTENLTCVDCLKDFLGNAYVAHTTCLTEDEKYAAKGFKSKPPSDKGAKKMLSWMSTIQEIQMPPSLSAFQKRVIDRCQNSPNVPQKRLKFQNFCKSNFGKFADIKQIDEVFDLFEREHKKSVDDSNNDKSGTKSNSSGENNETNDKKCSSNGKSEGESMKAETNEDEDGDVKMENGAENDDKSKKLSKKEKKELKRKAKLAAKLDGTTDQDTTDLESSNVLENCENENIENETMNGSSKKDDSSMEVENGQCNEEEETGKHLSKKEKKKLKKQEKYQAQLNEIEQTQMTTDDIDNEIVTDENETHKKKKQKAEMNGAIENGSKKSKKRNREDCDMDIDDIDDEQPVKKSKDSETHENGDLNTTETEATNGKQQFDWSDIIVQVLQSRKDKELPIKRLAKKVITEYQTNYATYETFEKISAKFHKKLKKIPGVKVLHDKAKLVSADE